MSIKEVAKAVQAIRKLEMNMGLLVFVERGSS